jgi:hypothetical protein
MTMMWNATRERPPIEADAEMSEQLTSSQEQVPITETLQGQIVCSENESTPVEGAGTNENNNNNTRTHKNLNH